MNYRNLPETLTTNGLFCCWRYEERNGKRTKVPYQPMDGNRAQSNNPNSFASYSEAVSAKGYDGIGIGIFGDFCAIDLDHCLEDNSLTAVASDIIKLMHSYTEISPSGDGIHILFSAHNYHYDKKSYYIMNRNDGIEVYVSGATNKYVTVTGQRFNSYDFGDRSKELQYLLDRYMRRKDDASVAVNAINATNPLTDDALIRMAMSSKNGDKFARLWKGCTNDYPSHSEADYALCSILAFWTGKDASRIDSLFRKSGLMRGKWDRKQSGTTYGQITIQNAIQHCKDYFSPSRESSNAENILSTKTQTNSFPPIVPLKPHSADLPRFPIECLPADIQNYVKSLAIHSQTAPDMAAVISLGVLSICLQGKYQVEDNPGHFEPLSLYVVIIASPSERKSSVLSEMTRAIYEFESEKNLELEPEIRKNQALRRSLERKISGLSRRLDVKYDLQAERELEDLQNQLEDTPVLTPVRYTTSDCSSESLAKLLANYGGRFAVVSAEGGIFDIMAGRYTGKANFDVWLCGHSGDRIIVDRIGRETEVIPHPALTAILTVQPKVLDEIMSNQGMLGRGLISRFLFSSPPSMIGSRLFSTEPIQDGIVLAYRNMIFRLMSISNIKPVALSLSLEARKVMEDYFVAHEKYLIGEGQDISDWGGKYIGAVMRIAGLLHVASSAEITSEISADTVSSAIAIGKYFLSQAKYAYSLMGTDLSTVKARFVLSKLEACGASEIKRSDLYQQCRGKFFKKTEDIFPSLELLKDHGYIRFDQPEQASPGRPKDVVIVINPAILPTPHPESK